MSAAPTPRTAELGTLAGVRLVAGREIMARLRSKSFLISTGILLLIVLGSILVGGFMAKNQGNIAVAVVGTSSELAQLGGVDVTEASDVAEAKTLVSDGTVEAAIVPDDSTPFGFAILAQTEAPAQLTSQLSMTPPVILLDEDQDGPEGLLAYLVALGFGLIFFVSALTFGMSIAQSVVEEKQTRVVEILMSAIPVRVLLAGKVVGNSVLAFAQVLLIAVFAAIGLGISGLNALLDGLTAPLTWFVFFFIVGFVLLAAMFAATGAMVSRQEDIGSTTTPVTMLVMLPYFLIIFLHSNPVALAVMSYVPFSAPVAMPMRVFLGSAEWWEPILSLVILAVTAVLVIGLGAKIYRNSLLTMGSRVSLGRALKG